MSENHRKDTGAGDDDKGRPSFESHHVTFIIIGMIMLFFCFCIPIDFFFHLKRKYKERNAIYRKVASPFCSGQRTGGGHDRPARAKRNVDNLEANREAGTSQWKTSLLRIFARLRKRRPKSKRVVPTSSLRAPVSGIADQNRPPHAIPDGPVAAGLKIMSADEEVVSTSSLNSGIFSILESQMDVRNSDKRETNL